MTGPKLAIDTDPAWREQALCAQVDPTGQFFFIDDGGQAAPHAPGRRRAS